MDSLRATQRVNTAALNYCVEMRKFLTTTSTTARKYKRRKLSENYVLSDKCILRLLDIWLSTCSSLTIVNLLELKRPNPYKVSEYLQSIKLQVMSAQDILQKTYVITLFF